MNGQQAQLVKTHKAVAVDSLPSCDLCPQKAYADAKLPMYGSWANVCKIHFAQQFCQLGLGKGQELISEEGKDNE